MLRFGHRAANVPKKPSKSLLPPPTPEQRKRASILTQLFLSARNAEEIDELLSKPIPTVLTSSPAVPDQTGLTLTSSELKRLGRRFKKLDEDHSGSVSLKEFLRIPEISRNVLANRVVEIFDANHNGEVDFQEFVEAMSQFSLPKNAEGRLRFAFKIFDLDGSGFISNGELFQVLKIMVGNNLTDVQVQQTVDHTFMIGDTDRDGKISFREFKALVKNNSTIHTEMVLHGV